MGAASSSLAAVARLVYFQPAKAAQFSALTASPPTRLSVDMPAGRMAPTLPIGLSAIRSARGWARLVVPRSERQTCAH